MIRYLLVGRSAKQKYILNGLGEDAREAYFKMFSRNDASSAAPGSAVTFEEAYSRWYERSLFVRPGFLPFAVGSTKAALVLLSTLDRVGCLRNPLFNLPKIVVSAIQPAPVMKL